MVWGRCIHDGNSEGVKDVNGSFSFLIPTKTYMVQSVQKKGYELVDADAIKKTYQHSANPLYIVMETPEQQMEDLLEAQEQISKTLREQLKKSRQEIQRLKDENKITEEDYRQRLAKLMEDQQNSQRLIADMAKEYSQMDYDLILAIQAAGVTRGRNGFHKNKAGEKLAESEEDLLEHRTDGTDAFDTLFIGAEKFPQQEVSDFFVGGIS